MGYTLRLWDLQGNLVASQAPFASATVTWELDGPGSLEVTLREHQVGSVWLPGRRRIELRQDGTPIWGGWLLGLDATWQAGQGSAWTARALGYAAPLEHRVVLGDVSFVDTVSTQVAWGLIQHAQGQPNGDLGITLGTITGTAPAVSRHYCDGDKVLEAIDALASRKPGGFDWEVDAQRRFNAWVGGRGTDRRASVSFAPGDVRELKVTGGYAGLATYAHAFGADPDGPCGPPFVTRAGAIASSYLRADEVIDADVADAGELAARADHELEISARSRLRLEATVAEARDPVGLIGLELGDVVTADLPGALDGSVPVRLISRAASLESRAVHFWTFAFEVVT